MPATLHSIAIFVTEIERAKRFYRDVLELPLVREGSFGAEFLDGPAHLGVHPAVHPDARSLVGRHTGITLHIEDILGFCERLHERGVHFLAEPTRQAFGVPIGEHQLVKEMIAQMVSDYDASRLLWLRAGWMKNEGLRNTRETSLAKWFATVASERAAGDAKPAGKGGEDHPPLPQAPVPRRA